MEIPYSRWSSAISRRRSRRIYDPERIVDPAALAALDRVCQDFRPFPHARTYLVRQPREDVFKGVVGGYGKVVGAPSFVAFIGDMSANSVQEEVGYTGEGVILEATALGLNTCWVGGFFRPEVAAQIVGIRSSERVLAVSPVGYAVDNQPTTEKILTGFGLSHKRSPLSNLVWGVKIDQTPAPVRTMLEAARLAPSAINRQPWGFELNQNAITVFVRTSGPEFTVSKRLDCGIAMLHIEIAALDLGMKGQWELLDHPGVGRFVF